MFLSSYENKIDKKGLVSVPAPFRSHLTSLGYNGFICYPSFNHSALEACSQDRIEKLSNKIDSLNPFEERLFCYFSFIRGKLIVHTEGKFLLRNCLTSKIKNSILYVGLGKTFWEPKNFEKFKALARKSFSK